MLKPFVVSYSNSREGQSVKRTIQILSSINDKYMVVCIAANSHPAIIEYDGVVIVAIWLKCAHGKQQNKMDRHVQSRNADAAMKNSILIYDCRKVPRKLTLTLEKIAPPSVQDQRRMMDPNRRTMAVVSQEGRSTTNK